ncbi:MAG: DUF3105 domain-containing protein [Actinomycetota bacterium]
MPPKKKKRAKGRGRGQGARAAAGPNVERVDPNEKRRERIEQKRRERERAALAARRRHARERVVRWIVIATVTAALVWFFFLRGAIPDSIAGHEIEHYQTFAQESRSQQLHVEGEITNYESNPPVSGEHHAMPAACGVYSQPLPEEDYVHTLEHGAVGLLYQPTLDPEQIEQLEAIVQDYESHMFSMPYPQLEEDPVVVTAWAHLMRLDGVDGEAIREFTDVFREGGDAPEEADCPLTQDDPFDPDATPTGTPSPEPSPEPTRS